MVTKAAIRRKLKRFIESEAGRRFRAVGYVARSHTNAKSTHLESHQRTAAFQDKFNEERDLNEEGKALHRKLKRRARKDNFKERVIRELLDDLPTTDILEDDETTSNDDNEQEEDE